MYYKQKMYKDEFVYNEKLLNLAKISGSKNDECEAMYKIGSNYSHLNNYSKATELLDSALGLAVQLKSKVLQNEILESLSSLEYKKGNYKRGFELIQENMLLSSDIFSEESQQQINFLDAKYQAQKREGEIRKLEDEKRIKDIQISKRQQWIYSLLSIIALLLVLASFIQINYRNKRKLAEQDAKLKEKHIQQLEKEKQLLATQSVLQGEEAERGRLAKDLHDGLGGLLSGVKLSLTGLKVNYALSDENVKKFDHTLDLLDSSIKEMRRISHNMMPEALIKFGIKDALADFCSNLEKQIKINFNAYGTEKRINQDIEISLYRIAQELINNAIKHSQANELIVQLIVEDSRVNLTVQDNGKGFDTTILSTSKGAGIANIRSRVEAFNGRIDIYSEPGKGAEFIVEFKV
jgi:signal transduction histidine kinase